MNVDISRIKKEAVDNFVRSFGYGNDEHGELDKSWFNPNEPAFQKKIDTEFAKLIAKECVIIIERANKVELPIIDCINEHFGIWS